MRYKDQVKGTRILFGDEVKYRRKTLNTLINILEKEGFNEIILPSLEPSNLYTDKAGKEILKQMYTFKDKKGRDICLRPEGTATIQVINNCFNKDKDLKLWYLEKCWRYERPQKGRYREFWQLGVEIINPSKSYTEYLINLGKTLLNVVSNKYTVTKSTKRGLAYYTNGTGFEMAYDELGAQKQVLGGGLYKNGIGFAIGIDRLLLVKPSKKLNIFTKVVNKIKRLFT